MAALKGRGPRPAKRNYRYNTKLIRRDFSYSIEEIADLFSVHVNAVRRWLKEGLRRIDDRKPYLVHGTDLIAFLTRRQAARQRHCEPGQMYCVRCREPRLPRPGSTSIESQNERRIVVRGACELCGSKMNRFGLAKNRSEIEFNFACTSATQRLNETSDGALQCDFAHQEPDTGSPGSSEPIVDRDCTISTAPR